MWTETKKIDQSMWLQLCPMKIHEKKSTGISDTKKEQQQQKNDATSGKEKENLIKLCSPSHLAPTMADQTVQFGRDRRLSTRPISGTAERETKMQWKKKQKERKKKRLNAGWGSRMRIADAEQADRRRPPKWGLSSTQLAAADGRHQVECPV